MVSIEYITVHYRERHAWRMSSILYSSAHNG